MAGKSVSEMSLEELLTEKARISGQPMNAEYRSVLDITKPKEFDTLEEFKKLMESSFKGSARGIAELIGGWGNLYDYLKESKDPSAFSTAGITKGIQSVLTNKGKGVNIMEVPGYTGAFEFARAGAPAALATSMGVPGLFGRTVGGVAKEFGVAGTGGLAAEALAPNSPLGSLAIQTLPYAGVGGVRSMRERFTTPVGQVSQEAAGLLSVGPLTPGEATGSRVQLAREAKTEATPSIEKKGVTFRQEQTTSVENFLNNLFNSASQKAITPAQVTEKVSSSFTNYGKALASNLKKQASTDFNAAEKAGGMVDTGPVVDRLTGLKNSLRPDLNPADATFSNKIQTILDSLVRPEVPEVRKPSMILGEGGQPAFETVTAGTPAGTNKISISDLKRALSGWGDAAWSGNYTLNNSNVFEGLAPGQAKGVARTVLNGFRDALNNAIDTNVPGAELLKDARTNFSKNLDKIDEFAEMPVVKEFGKPVHQLVPEDIINKLKDQPPSQRALTIGILQNNAPQVLDSVRKAKFNDILTASQIPNAPAGSPNVDFGKLLGSLNDPQEMGFLFSNPADMAKASQAIKYIQQVLQKAEGTEGTGIKGSDIYSVAKAGGGTAQSANLVKELFLGMRDLIANPNAMADVVFNKDTVNKMIAAQNKSTLQSIGDVSLSIGKTLGTQALRAGPRMSTENPVSTEEAIAPNDLSAMTLEQLQAERNRILQEQQGGGGQSPYPRIELNNMSPSQP